MSADFEAEIRNSLRALNSQVTALGSNIDKLQGKGRVAGQEVAKAFQKTAVTAAMAKRETAAAAKESANFGKSIKASGEALTKMGGPLGEILGKLTGGAGLSGGLARAGVAAALFGIALKAGNAVMEATLDRTQKLIAAQREYGDIKREAVQTERQQALGAFGSQGDDLRQLFTRGNVEAIDTANHLAKAGIDDAGSIRKGVAKAYTLTGFNEKETVIEAAAQAAHMGDMGFDEGVSALMQDRGLLKSMMAPGGFKQGMERFILKGRGLPATAANRAKVSDELTFSQSRAREGYYAELNSTQGALNEVEKVGQDRFLMGGGAAAAKDALSRAAAPEGAALVDLARQQLREMSELKQLAAEQGKFYGFFADVFKPGGSFETQMIRLNNARAGAQFAPGG